MNSILVWSLLTLAAVGLAAWTGMAWRRLNEELDDALTLLREPTRCEPGMHDMRAHQAVWACAKCPRREPRNALFYDREAWS